MTHSIVVTQRPWYTRSKSLVGIALALVALLVAAFVMRGGLVPKSDAPTLQYTTNLGEGHTEGTVDAPLRATIRVPWSNGSPDTGLSSVSFQLLDAGGQPARFAGRSEESEAMKPALEIGVWVYDGSLPSEPGSYHAHVQVDELKGTSHTYEITNPILVATKDNAGPLTGGFVFASNANLWLLSSDTHREKRLTFYPSYYELAEQPAWSPDGKSIAFTYSPRTAPDELPYTEIWAVNPDGSGARQLAAHGKDESLADPAWSLDGKSLYFTVQTSPAQTSTVDPMGLASQSNRIDQLGASTGARTQVIQNAKMLSMDPLGKTIVYLESVSAQNVDLYAQGTVRLMRAEAKGANPQLLAGEKAFLGMQTPRISPDGKWVVFSAINVPPSGGRPPFDLWRWLTFSPAIAYAHGLPWDLFLVSSEGGSPIRLTELNEDQPTPVWLDNSTIAFMGTTGLYKMSIDSSGKPSGKPVKIHDGAPHGGLTWHSP